MRVRRALSGVLLVLALVAGTGGCKRHRADDTFPRFRSIIVMSDPRSAAQLLSGFHSVEAGAWRWTERRFSVSLARPPKTGQNGATLSVKLTVPPVSIEQLKSLQLTAVVSGSALDPETYTAPGDYVYRRAVPASLLGSDPVRVDFSLDKAIPPGNPDVRELGVVVLAIGLEPR
jgi:hypothetical protein